MELTTLEPTDRHVRQLVIDAMHPSHPLHHRFEWDTEKAANERRLTIAQQLIDRYCTPQT